MGCALAHCSVLALQPFMYGDYIAYDCWLGKVYDLKNQIILKLSNGARWVSAEGSCLLHNECNQNGCERVSPAL